jgi:DNA modification methylase
LYHSSSSYQSSLHGFSIGSSQILVENFPAHSKAHKEIRKDALFLNIAQFLWITCRSLQYVLSYHHPFNLNKGVTMPFGPDNPHPFSQLKTELIWQGKYDVYGKRLAPQRLKLPFQTVETVNESAQQRQLSLDMFNTGRPTEWRNRLIWGDKKYVLPALLDEFAGKVNLIYIDPPFNVGADFSFTATIPSPASEEAGDEGELSFLKEPSILEQKAYRDTWGRGLDSYLQWFYETILLLYELLSNDGSIYVHLDEHISHYAKAILDEILRKENFKNEIIWKSTSAHSDSGRYGSIHQTLLFYVKGATWTWNKPTMDYDEDYIEQYYRYKELNGRRFKSGDLSAYGLHGGGYVYEWNGHTKPWRLPIETMQRLHSEGRIFYTKNGIARLKSYLDEAEGMPAQTLWLDKAVQYVVSWGEEKVQYATQKSEGLLSRIIKASSNEGDMVLDCFCGSGTTPAVAEKLNRRWIACDLGRFAIHTTRKRLLSIDNVRPFVVQNLGKYERQAWQSAEFGDDQTAATLTSRYRRFILDLYHAQPITGYAWLHGLKQGRMVHIGPVDSPITPADVTQIAIEFRKAVGSGQDAPKFAAVDVLGWDFAFELNEVALQQANQAHIAMRFVRIPREVLESKAVEAGDIRFFELAALAVETAIQKRQVTLKLSDFVIPPDDVPEDVQRMISHWSQWIDYWAVDWDNKGDTFHNLWQAYRTRQDQKLQLQVAHTYTQPGDYRIMVKVIDILGNDTTKTLSVTIN